MSHLPVHPATGLRALGMSKRGPIWPVLGGSEDADVTETTETTETAEPDAQELTSHGYPKGVPVDDMTPEEQAAYWKFHARKHENTVKAFKGKTPKQIADMEQQLKTFETDRMSTEEKAIAEAVANAEQATRTTLEQEWQGKYRTARLEAIAGRILDDDALKSFMDIADTSKFVGEDGEINSEAVIGHLTAIYGQPRQFGSSLPQHMNWGQNGSRRPAQSGIEQANAMLAQRHGVNKPNS
ncbi:hypothetical protein [Nocardia spumae]|uniref:hypothetical protein n=1 Tax=Nocardia spumae TaxID=2887190 RepID=UPI001D141094|nr:hypothetical protein [Nocardia spumae]